MPVWLCEADVRALLPMHALIDAMEQAVTAFSSKRAVQPVRTVFPIPGGFFGSMPAVLETPQALGAKLVTLCASNTAKGLPTHLATIVLLDPNTGDLLAVMDGRYITEARTAAASAVAARYLARPDASTLAIIGSGVQARSHLEALSLVRSFKDIRCWSPTADNLQRFIQESSASKVRGSMDAREAVEGADVIVLATSSRTPVIQNDWIMAGACVLAVGACRPVEREMDPALVARSRLFVDSRAAALEEAGDIVQCIKEGRFSASHIVAELGEVVANPKLGRVTDNEVTVFKSLGIAVEDVASAHLAYRRARDTGRGVELGS